MEILREALEDTIRTTPFNTFRNVLLAADEESPMALGGNCRHQLQVLSDKVGPGLIRFLKCPDSGHYAGITETKDGIFLVDPSNLTFQPINISPVVNGSRIHVQGNAFPLIRGKPSKMIVMKNNEEDVANQNRISACKKRLDGGTQRWWEYNLADAQETLPPETLINQIVMRAGTIALSVLMPDLSVYQLKQQAGKRTKTATKLGGRQEHVKYHEHEKIPFGKIVDAIAERINLESHIILDRMNAASRLYPQFTQPF